MRSSRRTNLIALTCVLHSSSVLSRRNAPQLSKLRTRTCDALVARPQRYGLCRENFTKKHCRSWSNSVLRGWYDGSLLYMCYKESYVLNKSGINMTLHILLIKYIASINICFLFSTFLVFSVPNIRMLDKFKYMYMFWRYFLARKKCCDIFD